MKTEHLIESRARVLALNLEQVAGLRAVGQRLASDKRWWGASDPPEDPQRTVITSRPESPGKYEVIVHNAVGIVSIGSLQLVIGPKIPTSHLLYLMARSGRFPRIDSQRGLAQEGEHLWELVAQWFVSAIERLLRTDLLRDYSLAEEFLSAKRGRMSVLTTTRAHYRGRIGLHCEFDEFGSDTPLNRVLRAAARVVVGSPAVGRPVRRRAAAAVARMEGAWDRSDTLTFGPSLTAGRVITGTRLSLPCCHPLARQNTGRRP